MGRFYFAKKYKWFHFTLPLIKELLLGRRANEKDNIILITGSRGDGKTTFVGKVLFQFEDFQPYESMVYSKEAMFELVKKKNGYIWGDEAVVSASRGNTMTRANKLLHEMFTINRDNYNMVFFCMPSVEDFDTKILQYVSMWVHIDSRGLGVVMMPNNKGILGKKNWDIDGMKKIYEEFQRDNKTGSHIPYWCFDNFRGYIKFGKLTVDQDRIIKEIKAMRKNENLDKTIQNNTVIEIKQSEDYAKYSAKKITEMIAKGEIRDIKTFEDTCNEMKLDPTIILRKCDHILKISGANKTSKQLFKEFERVDNLVKF